MLPIWPSIRMWVDPCEVVGGNLAFIPQLYDRWERSMLLESLPSGGVFVDVGSNIGAYALWAASCVGQKGRVLALEADPDNFVILEENVALNQQQGVVFCRWVGVADERQTLRLYKNQSGNRGAHSFMGTGEGYVEVQCETLANLVLAAGLDRVDIMKLDIEGFEEKVLSRYFLDVPEQSLLRPRYLLVEIDGGPVTDAAARQALKDLICRNGYEMLVDKSNSLFRKRLSD